jgi:hypothetical protein
MARAASLVEPSSIAPHCTEDDGEPPTLGLFVSPYGKLYLKLQIVLAEQPFELSKQRPSPRLISGFDAKA